MSRRCAGASALVFAAAALVVVVSTYPFLYAVATSFKTGSALFDASLWPAAPTWHNYRQLFEGHQPFGRHLLNSLMAASATVALSLAMATTAAFALGRRDFRGKATLLVLILAISVFPQVAVLSGTLELMQALGLYNRTLGLVLPYTAFTLPFTVWLLATFMRELPRELEEAAIMDGCGPLRIIGQVFMPLLWPALVSAGLLAFVGAWNEFLFALTFVTDDSQRTVPVSIASITGASSYEIPWGSIMAASTVVTVPLLALVLVFQRKIVAGLTAGAVKA